MGSMAAPEDPLSRFGPATRAWFTGAFAQPTAGQAGAWDAVARDQHALVVAPTGSGKTLAAFLWSIDRIMSAPPPEDRVRRCRVLYVSPLKALAADVQRDLRSPLTGIRQAAARDGVAVPDVTVGMRTGDTPPASGARSPPGPGHPRHDAGVALPHPHVGGPRGLAGVETVMLDEIHAVAGTKRGAHLALSLERLDALLDRPAQRIGLSATVRPVDVVSRFLGGGRADSSAREVVVVQPPSHKEWAIDVVVPVPDLADLDSAPATGPADAAPSSGDDEIDLSGEATVRCAGPRSGRTSRSAWSTSWPTTPPRSSSPTTGAAPSG